MATVVLDTAQLRRLVTWLVPAGKDEAGGDLPFIEGDKTWCSINFKSGKNQFGGNTFVAEATHLITMRYRPGVLPAWRLRYQGTEFSIIYMDNLQQDNVQLDLYCTVFNGAS